MQRFIGSVLVIAATTGAGVLYGVELQNYLEKMFYLRRIIYLLKGELEYSNAPLGEVFGKIGRQAEEPYRHWMLSMERQIEEREEVGLFKIWTRSIDQSLGELHLKVMHIMQLKEIGTFLGRLDQRAESRNLQMYLERLELEIEKIRRNIAAKKRIGSCLGVMSGLFLVIVLI